MAVAARVETGLNVAAYKVWVEARPGDERWELIDGVPVMMSPPSARHQRIVANLIRRLDDLAERRGCNALPGFGVLSAAMDDYAPIPDIVVTCGPLGPDGYTRDPVLLAEVLSPSTQKADLGAKTMFYRTVPSLCTFLMVDQETARVEVWRRGDAGWSMRGVGPDEAVDLPELDGTLAVSEIYARVGII
ncbi:Uma2 family endonuclease [Methylobacterium sp. J-090]|uniref:Uma2 family endonuclease n=1 Tax=Methylobacterium sp. J-090 TaxID=2836666 RepID=UPI001FB943AB|nr:Uma2 family endonuclease [Methylobacterium sp. J-090]MCJ2083622.1 Uma2 family endonuclease [Methylobacterium sp. J-090]